MENIAIRDKLRLKHCVVILMFTKENTAVEQLHFFLFSQENLQQRTDDVIEGVSRWIYPFYTFPGDMYTHVKLKYVSRDFRH